MGAVHIRLMDAGSVVAVSRQSARKGDFPLGIKGNTRNPRAAHSKRSLEFAFGHGLTPSMSDGRSASGR